MFFCFLNIIINFSVQLIGVSNFSVSSVIREIMIKKIYKTLNQITRHYKFDGYFTDLKGKRLILLTNIKDVQKIMKFYTGSLNLVY